MNVICVLMDSLNRHFLPAYGNAAIATPNLERLRRRAVTFDSAFGQILDRMDDGNLWDNTLLIVMTDHGHFLGEHGWWGKPGCPQYRAISHVPLFVHVPGGPAGTRSGALATHVDVHATILDALGCPPPAPIDGVSLLPAVRGEAASVREGALFGWWAGTPAERDAADRLRALMQRQGAPPEQFQRLGL